MPEPTTPLKDFFLILSLYLFQSKSQRSANTMACSLRGERWDNKIPVNFVQRAGITREEAYGVFRAWGCCHVQQKAKKQG